MGDFETDSGFEAAATPTGGLELGALERYYERFFKEVLVDGVITFEERERLDELAGSLRLDRERLDALETALVAAHEAHHGAVEVRDQPEEQAKVVYVPMPVAAIPSAPPPERHHVAHAPAGPAAVGAQAPSGAEAEALRQRVRELEAMVERLSTDAQAAADAPGAMNFAGVAAVPAATLPPADAADLCRKLEIEPRDPDALRALHRAVAGDPDRSWCVASVLDFLGVAKGAEEAEVAAGRRAELPHPTRPLDGDDWRFVLSHPDEDPLVGEIFALIQAPALLGIVSARRRTGTLPGLEPGNWLAPERSAEAVAQCFGWGARVLGMDAPLLYRDPEQRVLTELSPGMPPALRLGAGPIGMLTPWELAFLAGRWLAMMRSERFMHLLVPGVDELSDMFVAALIIGRPGLPINPDARTRAAPIAEALRRFLDSAAIAKLEAAFQRFVERGGRTNLQRWADAAERTAARAGLLLCGDLDVARAVLVKERPERRVALMDDLLVFATGERYSLLRKRLGIAVSS